jgi:hypothetical protein
MTSYVVRRINDSSPPLNYKISKKNTNFDSKKIEVRLHLEIKNNYGRTQL